MGKTRRPCPRGLYDGCPIPRELCTEDFERTGAWHCLKFLREFEHFVFGAEAGVADGAHEGEGEIATLEALRQTLEGMDEEG